LYYYSCGNFVTRFPCGIIEQAYRQLIAQGFPLVGNVTPKSIWRERVRQLEEEKARANWPAANPNATEDGGQPRFVIAKQEPPDC
jgi:hypothetical protein